MALWIYIIVAYAALLLAKCWFLLGGAALRQMHGSCSGANWQLGSQFVAGFGHDNN